LGIETLTGVLEATTRDPADRPGVRLIHVLNGQERTGVGGQPPDFHARAASPQGYFD